MIQDLLFSLCNGINAAAAFLFGLFVLTKNAKSRLHQLWFCMSLAVANWGGFHLLGVEVDWSEVRLIDQETRKHRLEPGYLKGRNQVRPRL